MPCGGVNNERRLREAKLYDDPVRLTAAEYEHDKLEREQLAARLREVTEQRDKLLSQFEAMALQVDESVREIDEAQLDAQHNAKKADDGEHHAQQETARADQLSRQLDEERRKKAEIAAEFARFREASERPPVDDPWRQLWCAVSQIVSNWVAWARAKIPPDSALLPWFDRTVLLAKTTGRLGLKWCAAVIEWAKPRISDLLKRLTREAAKRMSKE